jgi:hypothetical protein
MTAIQPTLGTMVHPEYQNKGNISPDMLVNYNIKVNSIQDATFPLGFIKPYFKSETEQEYDMYHTKAQSEYLEGIRSGLSPLNAYNRNNSYPTNLNYTTTPFKNLGLDKDIIPFKYGSSSWDLEQKSSRSDYQTNMGREIIELEMKARGNRLY